MSVVPVTLADGVTVVPSGSYFAFNATLFDSFSAIANIQFDPAGGLILLNAYTGPVNPTSFSSSLVVSAYANILDPLSAYFYVKLTLGTAPNGLQQGIGDLICKFGKWCGLASLNNVLAAVPATAVITSSFALQAQSISLINGDQIDLAQGFFLSFSTTIYGYSAKLSISATAASSGNLVTVGGEGSSATIPSQASVLFTVAGSFGAYSSGPFQLCASHDDCSTGPSFSASFEYSTASLASFRLQFGGYIRIFGIVAEVSALYTNTVQTLSFSLTLWDTFTFSCVFSRYQTFTAAVSSGQVDVAVSAGSSISLTLGFGSASTAVGSDLNGFIATIMARLQTAMNNAFNQATSAVNNAQNTVNNEYNACMQAAADATAAAARALSDCRQAYVLGDGHFRFLFLVGACLTHLTPFSTPPPSTRCYDGGSWSCGACYFTSCKRCGLKCGCGLQTSSCRGDCLNRLWGDCVSGCSWISTAVVSVTDALASGGCQTLNVASAVLSETSTALDSINSAVMQMVNGVFNGLYILSVTASESWGAGADSGGISFNAQLGVSVTYVLNGQTRTESLRVSTGDVGDIVTQFTMKLYNQIVDGIDGGGVPGGVTNKFPFS